MKTLVILAATLCAAAETAPRLFYSKSFPGSTPEFVAITLERTGEGEYREAADENPLKFKLNEQETSEVFALVEKVGWFTRPLESPLKVAFMGMKTFRVERGADKSEVKFNFSEDLDARALAEWFERISESEQHLIALEHAAKYDRLGVNKALLQFQSALERKRLILQMSRQRATVIAEAIRATK
jgi:hypothetical protein